MMRRLLPLLAWAVLVMSSVVASAQTTRPATAQVDATWVQQFFQSISDGSPDTSPDSNGVKVERFEKNLSPTFLELRNAVAGRSATVCLAYVGSPRTLASDISTALREQSAPDSIRQLFTPRSAKDMDHADEVASHWLQSVLNPAANDAVGVLVLCTDTDNADHPADRLVAPPAPMIVLIDAEATAGAGTAPRIRRIVFGDPAAR
jgi:hypothetical protein